MSIPYNEILPCHKAHDVFLFQECAAFARHFDVELLIGKGSLPDEELFKHYNTEPFSIKRLPIIRKNNPLNISWNRPFFHACQEKLEGVVILSVLKQAAYHLRRKKKNCFYVYEAHQLTAYQGALSPLEQEVFDRADLIVVTTEALKRCIQTTTPIAVIPLAVNRKRLAPLAQSAPFVLTYVGQLYKGQGVEELLLAAGSIQQGRPESERLLAAGSIQQGKLTGNRELSAAPSIELRIIGGTHEEIERLRPLNPHAKFYGFCPPSQIEPLLEESHAFVAPFELTGRMPFVAHTKLHEYAAWGRPFIAPDAPITREHFDEGVIFFKQGRLAQAIEKLQARYEELQKASFPSFSWEERIQLYLNQLRGIESPCIGKIK